MFSPPPYEIIPVQQRRNSPKHLSPTSRTYSPCFIPLDLNLSQTPRKNKFDKLEVGTASGLELTPLMSPARLSWTNSYLNLTSRLETIMTPLFHFGTMKTPMDQDDFDTK